MITARLSRSGQMEPKDAVKKAREATLGFNKENPRYFLLSTGLLNLVDVVRIVSVLNSQIILWTWFLTWIYEGHTILLTSDGCLIRIPLSGSSVGIRPNNHIETHLQLFEDFSPGSVRQHGSVHFTSRSSNTSSTPSSLPTNSICLTTTATSTSTSPISYPPAKSTTPFLQHLLGRLMATSAMLAYNQLSETREHS